MKVKEWHILLGLVALTALVQPVLADSDAVRGTWSGRWTPESGQRPVTVRFVQDGDAITGEMLNPEQLTFDSVTFDSEELSVVAEGQQQRTRTLQDRGDHREGDAPQWNTDP